MQKIKMKRSELKYFARMAAEAYMDDPVHSHCTRVRAIRKRFLYHFMLERLSSSNGSDIIYLDEEKRGICIWRDAKNDYTVFDFLKCPNWVFLVVYYISTIRTLITYSRRNLNVFPENTLLIEPVFVDKNHQGKGIDAALIKKGIEDLVPLGYNLGLEAQNPENVAFYEKLGFKVICEEYLVKGKVKNYSMLYVNE